MSGILMLFKFLVLLFLIALVINTLFRALTLMVIADTLHRSKLKQNPDLSRVSVAEPLGLPMAAFLTSFVALKGLSLFHLGNTSYFTLFACLIIYSILSYRNTLFSNMPRNIRGFVGELLVYSLFLLRPFIASV